MNITTPSITPPPAVAAANAQTAGVLSSDFETFLKMLTAQAKYQDPLEPIDSSEYAAQLAQFSMVEQQVLSNDLLSALTAQLGAGGIAQSAGWIGMEARTTAPTYFNGIPVQITPSPDPSADQAQLVVRNSTGAEVQRLAMPLSSEPLEWAGVTGAGTPFASGLYTFSVESSAGGQLIATTPALSYGRITEARIENGEPVLILQGGSKINADTITGLREPS